MVQVVPNPRGEDPHQTLGWGSQIFCDAAGYPLLDPNTEDLCQYFVDRSGYALRTASGAFVTADPVELDALDAAGDFDAILDGMRTGSILREIHPPPTAIPYWR